MGSSGSRVVPRQGPYSEATTGGVEFAPEEEVSKAESGSDPGRYDDLKDGRGFRKVRSSFVRKIRESDKEQTFAVTLWRPEEAPKALLFLCHGYAEYLSPVWDHVGSFFARRGILAFGHDHLGHGRTTGERVQGVFSFEEDYCVPVAAHCRARKALEGNGDLPVFILGHSLGGLIALVAANNSPSSLFRGVLATGPAITVDPDIATPVNIFLARCLMRCWPSKQLAGVEPDEITTDKDWVDKIKADELHWHGGLKAKQAYLGLMALEQFEKDSTEFNLPIFIQHGTEDKICRPEGSKELYAKIHSRDKTLKMYPGAKHNLFIERGEVPKQALKDCLGWIEERLRPEDKVGKDKVKVEEVDDDKKDADERVPVKMQVEETKGGDK